MLGTPHPKLPLDPRVKAAHRLKRLAPAAYTKAVREGRLPRV